MSTMRLLVKCHTKVNAHPSVLETANARALFGGNNQTLGVKQSARSGELQSMTSQPSRSLTLDLKSTLMIWFSQIYLNMGFTLVIMLLLLSMLGATIPGNS